MDFQLTDEHVLTRNMVREFAEKEIAPAPRRSTPPTSFPPTSSGGWPSWGCWGSPSPKLTGGAGGDYLSLLLALEEIARVSGSVAIILDAHTSLCASRSTSSARKRKSRSTCVRWPRAK